MKSELLNPNAPQWIILPNTGVQICRGFFVNSAATDIDDQWKILRKLAEKMSMSKQQAENEVVPLIKTHIACDQKIETENCTDWIACDVNEFAFFRLIRVRDEIHLDLVVDTRNGAGAQIDNKVPVLLEAGAFLFRKRHHLANIYVEKHKEARNVTGSLIMDFGNSGSAFVFSKTGDGPISARVVQVNNPFDPEYKGRNETQRNVLRSNMMVLRVDHHKDHIPWIVMGERAQELIDASPMATYLYAPKKYVRYWSDQQKAAEPSTKFRGILGQRDGLHPMLDFVQLMLDHIFQQVLSSLTNPQGTSDAPEFYPQIVRIMLTYPLTWRKIDQILFKTMVEEAAANILVQEQAIKQQFEVELTCSEPVAVAAYVLWETLFRFGADNLTLMASSLGNMQGAPELRMLVVDIGGGSTDIAYVDIHWTVRDDDKSVDFTFQMIESMRFNRAGDRISHILATAIYHYICEKYDISESLDFSRESKNSAFTRSDKRKAVSKISALAEAVKVILSEKETWTLSADDEGEKNLMSYFQSLDVDSSKVDQDPHLTITRDTLQAWIESDQQSLKTNGEAGFMDIFLYLEELCKTLVNKNRTPHIAILSGRSTRLPFIKEMLMEYTELPLHRIRTLEEILPDSLRILNYDNMDKLAVVCGAQRFRFGDHIRFTALEDEPIFNRYIGTVSEDEMGLKLQKIHIQPGDGKPQTITVKVGANVSVRIGHAFRKEGVAQVIAELSSNSSEPYEVKLNILDDFSVEMPPHKHIFLSEWVPGGKDVIVDNFNDTGEIGEEHKGFLKDIVKFNCLIS